MLTVGRGLARYLTLVEPHAAAGVRDYEDAEADVDAGVRGCACGRHRDPQRRPAPRAMTGDRVARTTLG